MSNNSSSADADSGIHYILILRLVVWGYVGIVLSLFGIVGNVITILVLISPSMRTTSTNIYLTALSCSNILFLLIFIPSYSIRYLLGYKVYLANQPPFAFEILLTRLPTTPIYNTILLSIIYLTIAVSTDRLILIKFPLKAKHILTPRATGIAILSIYIFSIVYCIPYWFEQRYEPKLKRCVVTDIGRRMHKYTRIYSYIPVVYLIPFVTLTFINISIIQNLLAKKRRKQTLGAKTNKKKQADYYITLMLVTVIIVFVLSELPLLVLNVWVAVDPAGSSESLAFHTLNSVGILLIVVNTSTNFLLYCFFGQKFRQTLIEFFRRLMPHAQKPSQLQARLQREQEKQGARSTFLTAPVQIVSSSLGQSLSTGSTTDDLKTNRVSLIKPDVPPIANDSNRVSLMEATVLPEESCPLLHPIEPAETGNEKIKYQPPPQPNLYTCGNGRRILVLRI